MFQRYGIALALILPLSLAVAAAAPMGNLESIFLADTERAMAQMDAGMMAKPTGNVDHDFVQMMVPHHQGAIDMAVAELRYGRDEHLKRIAQEIIVDQQQEIAAMRLALGQKLPASSPAPTRPTENFANHAGMAAPKEK